MARSTQRPPAPPSQPPHGSRAESPAIRVVMMPKDTNALGTIFGGVILSYIDQAGAVEAHRHCSGRIVTVAMREIVFHAPVLVGDLVSFYTRTLRLGSTSVTVAVEVVAERGHPGGPAVKVTEAEVVFVHVGADGRPLPLAAQAPEPKGSKQRRQRAS